MAMTKYERRNAFFASKKGLFWKHACSKNRFPLDYLYKHRRDTMRLKIHELQMCLNSGF